MHMYRGRRAAMMVVAISMLGLLAGMDSGWSRVLPGVPAVTARATGKAAVTATGKGKTSTTVKTTTVTTMATEYSGQATVINFTNIHMGPPFIIIGDTGFLPVAGGNIDVSVDSTNMMGLSLDLGTASTRGVDDATSSSISLNNLSVMIETVAGAEHTITVETVTADATASCAGSGPTVSATSQIQGLTVDGVAIEVTGDANQTVDLGDFSLVLNEQVTSGTATEAGIGLVAIHIIDP